MNKVTYDKVASIINATLRRNYSDWKELPKVEVLDTRGVSSYCDKWSLAPNNNLLELLQRQGTAQDLFYADEVYTVTLHDGRDFDLYIEPYNSYLFNLAVL